jgi:hypothetical protein
VKKFEITVLAENDSGQMVLMDRCTLQAENTADSARIYAKLFGPWPAEGINGGSLDYLPAREHDRRAFGRLLPDEDYSQYDSAVAEHDTVREQTGEDA